MATSVDIVHAYRHLYRSLLHAVQHASPARHIARGQLRAAFREHPAQPFNAEGVKRTLWFLEAAAKETGLEHRILKNLLKVRAQRVKDVKSWKKNLHESQKRGDMHGERDSAFGHYDMTVAMLNRSMGLCLR